SLVDRQPVLHNKVKLVTKSGIELRDKVVMRELKTVGDEEQERKTPSSYEISSKLQAPQADWGLELGVSLVFGAWGFGAWTSVYPSRLGFGASIAFWPVGMMGGAIGPSRTGGGRPVVVARWYCCA